MLGGGPDALSEFNSNPQFFNYAVLHEIGHALGLEHAFDVLNAGAEQTNQYTVMGYDPHEHYAGSETAQHTRPEALMLYDLAALQSLYGANTQTNSGNTHYGAYNDAQLGGDWISNVIVVETIWDPSGNADVFDTSNQTSRVILDLRQGEFSSIGLLPNVGVLVDRPAINNIAIAFDTVIEQAIGGSADDILIGNSAENKLDGGAGNDWIFGDGFRLIDGYGHDDSGAFETILGDVVKPTLQPEYFEGEYVEEQQNGDDDTLLGSAGADHIFGGAGGDDCMGASTQTFSMATVTSWASTTPRRLPVRATIRCMATAETTRLLAASAMIRLMEALTMIFSTAIPMTTFLRASMATISRSAATGTIQSMAAAATTAWMAA